MTFRNITIDGARTSYFDVGKGPLVLLLHGAPFTACGFFRMVRGLERHHRVIAPDLPGFGESECPRGFGGTLEEYARFVEHFCSALDLDRIHLYVNDASGCFGLVAAARVASRVRGLVVASTVQIPLVGSAWIVKQILKHVIGSRIVRHLNRKLNLLPWLVATIAPWLKPLSRVERAMLVRSFDTADKRDRVIDLLEQMGTDERFMRSAAALARDHLSEKPAMVLYGQFDPMRLIGAASQFRRIFRNSVLRIVRFEEHFPILASGDRVASLLHDWIAGLGEGEP